ncbi:MAG: tRNA (adenosine(37)-N6)-threonylcarbamoyltransferase complex dimerization subunit type 1 TsaB [Pseudotabrizicola sp.]|uniref:tRNA (adenosine(37)-N6)-threonylcarbamoyltransferase complex dimerization subunit type 1 TsaB n=1 Tax=Pseudotabrizicola sp. TaxID=2939647 RepID=UPI002724AD90|nr:tRNA (adenosine(37)-N6)-threonylcarbamoyltransferase complex dimerization subunit type 1 TsaB [Pseudotabrizicola sp.]MDO8881744.1 tRNA (adenosine(37)-N6)-threonylcarbamoyltransferase complex dimerization subunit type 1 TsaB [Pseudotabrizicola sp.]MDP2079550.1 tRNA (adenosine(37)-N6)-threonylcarbamoyltransferase complex dimerization subunit type 1 TsaB [Pseudotabrizicola sp.]MDZ7572382.1 tRNA (adenosine(37)-N6)-threonylcarbamoyltransferase complex dimerization subunit type 1 TsaB [Pseudotabriz
MPPETILAFDTSAAHCAAALLLPDGRCLIHIEDMAKGQAERLIPLLEEVLAEAGIGWHDLAAIGVGTGPGNFTGVRISVAAARGLALSLGVPAIGVTRFEALAHGLPRPLTVVEDARRDEVYAQHFGADGPEPARLQPRAGFVRTGPVTGSAAADFNAEAVPQPMPLVEAIARITATRLASPQPRPAPFYLRGADAAPPSDPPPVILDA